MSIALLKLPDKIIQFLKEEKVFSLATTDADNNSWSCNCFYVFNPHDQVLIFKSEHNTIHISNAMKNSNVSGTIYRTGKEIKDIIGVQFTGCLSLIDETSKAHYKDMYYKKLPIGKTIEAPFWKIKLSHIKMTLNAVNFGEKIIFDAKHPI